MRRTLACLSVALTCLSGTSLIAIEDFRLEDRPAPIQRVEQRGGRIVVTVVDISSRSPVPGLLVELLQSGETAQTGADGRVEFVVPPGDYDVRISGLSGPGPAARTENVHAIVRPRRTTQIRVFDCQLCV